MFDVDKIRAEFPILSTVFDGKRPLVYLDSGATAQKPRAVLDIVDRMYRRHNANVHRAVHRLSAESTQMYEQAREEVRAFIGAESVREIVFTSGATAAINLVAGSWGEAFIGPGDEIIVSEMEHHSNIVPWQLLCNKKGAVLKVLPFDDSGRLQIELLDGLLNERTRLVAVTQTSNVLGTNPDLEYIISRAHTAGALVLVDGCQGIVHSETNVKALDCDFYAFSGHKLYAPTGIGVLYAKEALLEAMPPYMGGGDMVASVSFEQTTYAELPLKFEAGTANYVSAVALAEAMRFILSVGRTEIFSHEHSLLVQATEQLSCIDGLVIYGNTPDKSSIVSFNIEGIHHLDMGMILDKMGIAVRTGTHCAEPIMQHYGVSGMVRASMAMYNTAEEIESLAAGVKKAAAMLL